MFCSSLPSSFFYIFISLSLFIAFILPNKDRKRRKWNDGKTDGWQERQGKKQGEIIGCEEKRGPFLAYINVWILKVLLLMCGCGCAALHLPPLLLLANHHTTLLYLGHSNVLLLSALADALCCNLRKIGWEEEKSEKSGRREGVVTGARSFLLSTILTSSFVMFFQYSFRLCFLPSLHVNLSHNHYFPQCELL